MSSPPTPVRIRIREVPASAGLDWIRRGWRAFRRQPGGFLGLFAMFLLATLAVSIPFNVLAAMFEPLRSNPALLQLPGLLMMPLLTLGYMLGTEAVMNDLRVRPHLIFQPLGASGGRGMRVLQVGLAYVVLFIAAWLFGNAFDDGEANSWLAAPVTQATADSPPVVRVLSQTGAMVLFLKMGLVAFGSVPLWHAPALVLWGGQPLALALFSSIVALWRTRAAFLVFLLGWMVVGFGITLLVQLVVVLTGGAIMAALVASMIGGWVTVALFYVALWFNFTDTFELSAGSGK